MPHNLNKASRDDPHTLSTNPAAFTADRVVLGSIALLAAISIWLGWHDAQLPLAFVLSGSLTAVAAATYHWAGGTLLSRMVLATISMLLVTLHIQLAHGLIESHFGMFVMLAFLLVYRDWRPIVLAAGVVIVHHLLFDRLQQMGWDLYCMAQAGTSMVAIHIAYVVIQTAVECKIALGMQRHLRAVADARHTLIQTLEQATDSVVVIDEDNRITLFNAAAERLWGYSRHEVLGENVKVLVPQGLQGQHDAYVNANRDTGIDRIVGTNREVPIVCKNGNELWGTMSISKVRLQGRIIYTAFIRDVTQQRALLQQQQLLSTAVHETDIAMIVTGPDLRIVFVNTGCVRMLGYEAQAMIGQIPTTVLRGQHSDPRAAAEVSKHALAGERYAAEVLVYTQSQRPIWVSLVMNPVHDQHGRLLNFVAALTDITHTKMLEMLQYKTLDAVAHDVPMPEVMTLLCREIERIAPDVSASIVSVDTHGRLRPLASPSLSDEFSEALAGRAVGMHSGSCGAAAWLKQDVITTDIGSSDVWNELRPAAQALSLRACWSTPIQGSDGRVVGTLALYYRDSRSPSTLHERLVEVCLHLCTLVFNREHTKDHIHKLAFYDILTGLPNRGMLLSQAERLIFNARRSNTSLAVLFIDLDRFKQVNDTRGHAVGDGLLRELAKRLTAYARNGDLIGRLSGDEFVAVLPNCNGAQATAAAKRLLTSIGQPYETQGGVIHPSASIGVAIYPQDGSDVNTLVRHADMAMYQSKGKVQNSYQFFSAALNQAAQERALLETDLRVALEQNLLNLYYQPQLSHNGAQIYGAEALLRWHHATLGPISPAHFVALAENCGLIRPLGEWVLRHACAQMQQWRQRGVAVPHVAINLSASNFKDAQLPQIVADTLNYYGLSTQDLLIEMTEGVMLDPDPVVIHTINAIHELGVRLSMDDFGTGYSSLSYLHRLPIHELKLDQSFVKDIEHSQAARDLTSSVLHIGTSLGLRVVAEGVESEAQRAFLAKDHDPVMQGFLFSRALPPAQLEQWLLAHAEIASLPVSDLSDTALA